MEQGIAELTAVRAKVAALPASAERDAGLTKLDAQLAVMNKWKGGVAESIAPTLKGFAAVVGVLSPAIAKGAVDAAKSTRVGQAVSSAETSAAQLAGKGRDLSRTIGGGGMAVSPPAPGSLDVPLPTAEAADPGAIANPATSGDVTPTAHSADSTSTLLLVAAAAAALFFLRG